MRDLLLIGIVLLFSLIAMRRPAVGVLTFVCFGLLNPQSMTWGIGRTFPLAQCVALGTIVGTVITSEPKKLPRQREIVIFFALWGMFLFSTIFAFAPDRAVEKLIYVSKIFLMVFFTLILINSERRLLFLMRTIALSLGFFGAKAGLFVILSGGNFIVWGPEGSFLEANNAIGLALSMNVALLFYLAKMESHAWLRRVMRVMFVLSYPAVVCTFSRGAWLGLVGVTALLIVKTRYKVAAIMAACLLAIVLLPLLPERVVSRYDDLRNYQEEGSAQSRFWNWEFCSRVGLAHPLYGGGFDYYSLEAYAVYFPEFLERYPGKQWSCHSAWFTVFGEHGFLGLFLWVSLLGSCFLSLRSLRHYGKAHPEAANVVLYADMLQASLVAYAIVGTFYDAAYFDLFYYLMAAICILKERIRERETLEAQLIAGEKIVGHAPTVAPSAA